MDKKELFSKNIKLAYYIADRYLINYPDEKEDIRQIALMSLWKAVLKFDGRVAFSSYACAAMINNINCYLRDYRKKDKYNIISINEEIKDYENKTIEDILIDKHDYIEESITKTDLYNSINNIDLNDGDKYILSLYMEGFTQIEISKKFGLSQGTISRILKNIFNKIKGEYNG